MTQKPKDKGKADKVDKKLSATIIAQSTNQPNTGGAESEPEKTDLQNLDGTNSAPDGSIDPKQDDQIIDKKQTPPVSKIKSTSCKVEMKDLYKELVKTYAKRYPDNKTFHITTDMQVFLSNGLSLAKNHQRTLAEGDVVTINIE